MELNNINTIKERDVALDCLKAFAIFLVLWGHSIQYMSSTHYSEQPVYRIIYSFHMPLFMALVGYFGSSLLNIESFVKVFSKKFKQLIIPAITFITLMCVLQFYPAKSILHGFKYVVINLWFLKSAFICSLLFYIAARNQRFRTAGIIISLICSQFIDLWYYQIQIMYPCFILGYYLHQYRTTIEKNYKKIILVSGIAFLSMLIFWDKTFWEVPELTINPLASNFLEYWYKTIYRIVVGISGTILFFTLFVIYTDKILPDKIKSGMQSLGTKTLGIYLVQSFLIEILLASYIKFDYMSLMLYNTITSLIAIICLIVCTLTVKLLQSFKISSFLLLGR